MLRFLLLSTSLLIAGSIPAVQADERARSDPDTAFFESRIRPVLVEHCYECHSLASGVSESGLRLDTKQATRAGGDRGPSVVPETPERSLLLRAIEHSDPDLQMPPRVERLPDSVIADFRRWIERGAIDPREAAPKAPVITAVGQDFWAYQRPRDPRIPNTGSAEDSAETGSDAVDGRVVTVEASWCRTTIDPFLLSKLQENGLRPSADAAPETLLRRLHFDLVGLPPTPEEIVSFVASVEAVGIDRVIASTVDRLIQSTAFGERWGRHWLDVARYAESSGKEANISFPYAWRYRDYVIDAVNADIPYDRFLTEQIAGDLLPAKDNAERTRLLIATGFLALGPKNLDATSPLQFAADLVDEQIDAVTRVFMASSVACARCHDHKFDPFSMEDYYALAGIFASTKTFFGTAVSPSNRVSGDPLVLPKLDSTLILHRSITPAKVKSLKAQKAAMQKEKADKGKTLTLRDVLRIIWRTGAIDGQLEKVDGHGKALPLAMGVLDDDTIRDTPLLLRGEVSREGEVIPRAFPRAISVAKPPRIRKGWSGRLELAQWLTETDHPLTARVAVNRIWSRLFGSGLVATVDDFGSTGQPPTHAELLDHLTIAFIRHGWSRKRLIREIVLSRAYRQSSNFDSESFQLDPENRWLWRMSKRRIEAEAMRDAMLSISGQIDLRRPRGSLVGRVIGDRPISLVGLDKRLPRDLDGARHRSVYLPVMRDRLPDVLEVFDFAEPSLVTGKRESTNVPTQALYLMNSPFVHQQSVALAKRLRQSTRNDQEFVFQAFQYCFGRSPTSKESSRVELFLQPTADGGEVERLEAMARCCQALISTAEFRVLD